MELALSLKDICAGYGKIEVLHHITLDIQRGEFLGIIGPNGAGKSTLLRVMSGVLRPWQGSIKIFGKDILSLTQIDIARILGYVGADLQVQFGYTVEELVWLGRFPHMGTLSRASARDRVAVEAALEACDVKYLEKRKFWELSAGEKQRVLIAIALAQEGEILLLDEATAHLDINHRYEIMQIVKRLNEEGKTIVFVSHDLNLASQYCKRLVVLRDGCMAGEGKPQEVITHKLMESLYGDVFYIINDPNTNRPLVLIKGEEDEGSTQQAG